MRRFRIIVSLVIASVLVYLSGCSEVKNVGESGIGVTKNSAAGEIDVTTGSEVVGESDSSDTQPASSSTEDPTSSDAQPASSGGLAVRNFLSNYETFEVTSSDLIDGVWSDIISNTHIGENLSPQLSWTPVEGAGTYVIYMVDTDTNGFLHWKSNDITETDLPRGWASPVDYIGPHIGHGYTHTFDIYVIALKSPVDRLKGAIDDVNPKLASFIQSIDTDPDGNSGNIISYGVISGSFTDARFRGDRTVDEDKAYYM